MITLVSWGRNHGPAPDSDVTVDATKFQDPPPAFRHLDGRHPEIQQIVLGYHPVVVDLVRMAGDYAIAVEKIIDPYVPTVAVGCNHGTHRSVAAVEFLARYLTDLGVTVEVIHRDLKEA